MLQTHITCTIYILIQITTRDTVSHDRSNDVGADRIYDALYNVVESAINATLHYNQFAALQRWSAITLWTCCEPALREPECMQSWSTGGLAGITSTPQLLAANKHVYVRNFDLATTYSFKLVLLNDFHLTNHKQKEYTISKHKKCERTFLYT